MCGIAGYYRRDGAPATREDAARMAATMAHRGPDGSGAWADGPVALGHVRLAIRDRSEAAAEPMHEPGGAGVLVYNGEVYNDGELRADLVREGCAFRSHGDAEVVMHAVARWGVERAARRFDGMFAFAWWDARARALWLVRDRFGTKPLHVLVAPHRVAFGSEARALRALPGVELVIDRFELTRRMVPWVADAMPPPFVGLKDVPPGEAWRIGREGLARVVYADVVADVDPERIVAGAREPLEVAQARVRRTVEEVVRAHVASDAPVAAFTSGGVDSNLVAAIALEVRPDLVAYTMDSGGPESELAAATLAARHLRLPLRPVHVDRAAFLRAWPDAVEAEEFPSSHESHVASLVLARVARADGVAVALTGEGSDELFGGYGFFERTRRRWARATRPWARWTYRGRLRRRELEAVPFRYQAVRGEHETHARLEAVLTASEDSRARRLMARFAPVGSWRDRVVVANGVDAVRRYLGSILMRHDRISMATSIEARVPFVSNRMADLGLHLPVKYKLRGRVGKWLLKRVAAERLPREIVYAKKKGFPVNVVHHRGSTSLLADGWVAEAFGWTKATVDELVPRIEADPVRRFPVVSLELFGRIHARGERPADLGERLLAAAR
jgi:asparagine synthase (glutamine-hydrolysing)